MNTASAPLLSRVAGVGPALAKKIVAYREKTGAFRSRFFELASPWGPLQQMRTPLTPVDRVHTAPPAQGEHTEAILREAGVTPEEIAAMRLEGALG